MKNVLLIHINIFSLKKKKIYIPDFLNKNSIDVNIPFHTIFLAYKENF